MGTKIAADTGFPAELVEPHAPVVLFDKVNLSFDEKVILRDVTFSVQQGHTKIFLGASGAGKSTILKLMLGLLKPDSGTIWVLGHRVDEMTEAQLMVVRNYMGMVFQEGALFDSLTVGENVGFNVSVRAQHEAFLRSAGHRRNIVHPGFRVAGFAVWRDRNGHLWSTQVFGAPRT